MMMSPCRFVPSTFPAPNRLAFAGLYRVQHHDGQDVYYREIQQGTVQVEPALPSRVKAEDRLVPSFKGMGTQLRVVYPDGPYYANLATGREATVFLSDAFMRLSHNEHVDLPDWERGLLEGLGKALMALYEHNQSRVPVLLVPLINQYWSIMPEDLARESGALFAEEGTVEVHPLKLKAGS